MKTKILLFAILLTGAGCGSKSAKTSLQDGNISYKTYCNERYDYCVDYPDSMLIPQGESGGEDGQTFISKDGQTKMLVYRDFKAISGDNPPIETAYAEDLKGKQITEKKMEDKYYFFAGTLDDKLFRQFVIYAKTDYFVIRFEYPKAEDELFKNIAAHVSESFNVAQGKPSEENKEDKHIVFLNNFISECLDGKNFNALLRDNDKRLKPYIDPKMDIRRYYNPGAVACLYTRSQNFGFGEEGDFKTEFTFGGGFSFKKIDKEESPCNIPFGENKSVVVYYQFADAFPEEMINPETFETRKVATPYPGAEIIKLYVPNKYQNPCGFYFINTPAGWKLAFVDDSLCSA